MERPHCRVSRHGDGGIVVGIDRVEHNVGVHSVRADLTDEDAILALLGEVVNQFDQIDVLYNNVGLAYERSCQPGRICRGLAR
jgi:NAD(P)-dependent dehydrogenase (short-subunit alcohol dehydrogenase family)